MNEWTLTVQTCAVQGSTVFNKPVTSFVGFHVYTNKPFSLVNLSFVSLIHRPQIKNIRGGRKSFSSPTVACLDVKSDSQQLGLWTQVSNFWLAVRVLSGTSTFPWEHLTHLLCTTANDFNLEGPSFPLPIISAPKVNTFSLHLRWFTEGDLYIIIIMSIIIINCLLHNLYTQKSILTIIIFQSTPELEVQLLKSRLPKNEVCHHIPVSSLVWFSLNLQRATSHVNRQLK